MTTPATTSSASLNGAQLYETAKRIMSLIALANPSTAGFFAAVTGAKALLFDTIIPAIKLAVGRGELTAEQEADLRAENDAFWAAVETGEAFSAPHWQPRPDRPAAGADHQ